MRNNFELRLSSGLSEEPLFDTAASPLGRLAQARRFAQLVAIARDQFGLGAEDRLRELRDAERERGEHELSLTSVRLALIFLLENACPMGQMFLTPTGALQVLWQLRDGGRVVARFEITGRISFGMLNAQAIVRVAGEDSAQGFRAIISSLREHIRAGGGGGAREAAARQTAAKIAQTEGTHTLIDTVGTQFGEILSAEGSGRGWQSVGISLSTADS
jgi:hypothetical protein